MSSESQCNCSTQPAKASSNDNYLEQLVQDMDYMKEKVRLHQVQPLYSLMTLYVNLEAGQNPTSRTAATVSGTTEGASYRIPTYMTRKHRGHERNDRFQ